MPHPTAIAALAAAPLYLAPFLSGLAAQHAALLPVFVAIWVTWRMVIRPATWTTPATMGLRLSGLWLTVLAHIVLLILGFALGRGFASVMALALALPYWVPVALALGALPLGHLLAVSRRAALDEADDPSDQGVSTGSGV